MFNTIYQKAFSKLSPFTIFITVVILVIWSDFEFVKGLVPDHSRPMITFMFTCISGMYESVVYTAAKVSKVADEKMDKLAEQIKEMDRQAKIRALKDAVNSMYARHMANGDKWITNPSEIRELAELTDLRIELDVNSYTQDRVQYLNSRVKR